MILIFGLHFAWNVCESVLFGLVNSGAPHASILIFVPIYDVYSPNVFRNVAICQCMGYQRKWPCMAHRFLSHHFFILRENCFPGKSIGVIVRHCFRIGFRSGSWAQRGKRYHCRYNHGVFVQCIHPLVPAAFCAFFVSTFWFCDFCVWV